MKIRDFNRCTRLLSMYDVFVAEEAPCIACMTYLQVLRERESYGELNLIFIEKFRFQRYRYVHNIPRYVYNTFLNYGRKQLLVLSVLI